MTALFSLIIPAYNSEKHISNCIESILSQNFSKRKYEIIIINDASKDKTQKICTEFKKKNKFIKILRNKKNLGVSSSRNLAIKLASGKYIIFIDSDDALKRNSLKKINQILQDDEIDLLVALNLAKKEKKIYLNKFRKKNKIHSKKDFNYFFKFLNSSNNFPFYPWNYIINRKFFSKNNIYFKQMRIFEDQEFTARALCAAKKIKLYKDSFHKHTERFGSLSRIMGFRTIMDCIKTINELCKMLRYDKLNTEKKKFVHERINFMLKYFKIHLLTCNSREIKKISFFIKKNISNFTKIKTKFLGKIILNQKKIDYIYKSISKYVDKSETLKINFKKNKLLSIYIFGLGLFGRATLQILKKKNINVTAFLDNNKNFYDKKYLGLKIFNPNYLPKINRQELENILVLISINNQSTSNKIHGQLLNCGLKNRNIKIINWKKIIGKTYS